MELLTIKQVDVSEDGQYLTMTFDADSGEQRIGATVVALNNIMGFLGRALVQVREKFTGQKVVTARPAKSYLADATQDRKAVIVELTGPDGVAERFAFDPRDAKAFQEQIADAVRRCGS